MDPIVTFALISLALAVVVLAALLLRLKGGGSADSGSLSRDLVAVRDELARSIAQSQTQLDNRFEQFRISLENAAKNQRDEATGARQELQKSLAESLGKMSDQVRELSDSNARKQTEMQQAVQTSIDKMQKGNEEKLEKMRETVDEKLQGTLEKRLGESFKLVSDRLESVQQGLGEMQALATGVGDLKRVLTNVKSRGTWGEVQLERQLADMLSPNQYEKNAQTKRDSTGRVEFAVKMPGKTEDRPVLLPIDSKFPNEAYERLLAAQETGEKTDIERATKAFESAIREQAKLIHDKYIDVPNTTNFAIMYLPTEGLFAEVVRSPGLSSELQNKFRVQVNGPSTLNAYLTSLQMGFLTLAMEKKSSEVWDALKDAKEQFRLYGQVWVKLEGHLKTAQNTVKLAKTRTAAIERKLRSVEVPELAAGAEDAALDAAILELESEGDFAE